MNACKDCVYSKDNHEDGVGCNATGHPSGECLPNGYRRGECGWIHKAEHEHIKQE